MTESTENKYYFTGEPCSKGHTSKRLVKNRSCVTCSVEKTRLWRAKNKDKVSVYSKQYHKANPIIKRVSEENRRAKKLQSGQSFTKENIIDLFNKQDGQCVYCKKELIEYHIDHIKPLSKGGSNGINNLQLLCPTDNIRKNNLSDSEYRLRLAA